MPLAPSDTVLATAGNDEVEANDAALDDAAGVPVGLAADAHAASDIAARHNHAKDSRTSLRGKWIIAAETPEIDWKLRCSITTKSPRLVSRFSAKDNDQYSAFSWRHDGRMVLRSSSRRATRRRGSSLDEPRSSCYVVRFDRFESCHSMRSMTSVTFAGSKRAF
jgi:hypothetical protein